MKSTCWNSSVYYHQIIKWATVLLNIFQQLYPSGKWWNRLGFSKLGIALPSWHFDRREGSHVSTFDDFIQRSFSEASFHLQIQLNGFAQPSTCTIRPVRLDCWPHLRITAWFGITCRAYTFVWIHNSRWPDSSSSSLSLTTLISQSIRRTTCLPWTSVYVSYSPSSTQSGTSF